jgi:hypothetical protein
MSDPPYVQEMTMTLSGGVTWEEATTEFHNFLRGAGYVIPYDFDDDTSESTEGYGWKTAKDEAIKDRMEKNTP